LVATATWRLGATVKKLVATATWRLGAIVKISGHGDLVPGSYRKEISGHGDLATGICAPRRLS